MNTIVNLWNSFVNTTENLWNSFLIYATKENLLFIALYLFLFAAGLQLIYYFFTFTRLAFYTHKKKSENTPPVSVIICARNELQNLNSFLQLVLEQDYPSFQVVVVNDCSWDETQKYLEDLETQYSHLKIVTLKEQERYRHGKKFALSLGIKAAANDILLMTDADCFPSGKNWIRHMVESYKNETEIVIGYGAYKKDKGLLNKWIRFDTVFNAMQYLSYALGANAYMGTGRNLSYKKSLFFRNKGFASHSHILSGDDDLFINETATKKNVSVCLHPESFTFSKAKTKFGDWLRQKKRHLSTGRHYKFKHKFCLSIFFIAQFLFYIMLAVLLISKFKIDFVLIVFGARLITQLFIFGKSMKQLNELDLLWLMPLFDVLIVLFYPFLFLSNLVVKNKSWK